MVLSFHVNQSADSVFAYLTDMRKFTAVHPVISRIDHLAGNSYLVYETLKLGVIPFSFTYGVTVDADHANRRVLICATVFKITEIKMDFSIAVAGSSTIVTEHITFSSPLPVKTIMERIFRNQHAQLFNNIAQAKPEVRLAADPGKGILLS